MLSHLCVLCGHIWGWYRGFKGLEVMGERFRVSGSGFRICVCSVVFSRVCVFCVCIRGSYGGFRVQGLWFEGLGFGVCACSVVFSHECVLCVYSRELGRVLRI